MLWPAGDSECGVAVLSSDKWGFCWPMTLFLLGTQGVGWAEFFVYRY